MLLEVERARALASIGCRRIVPKLRVMHRKIDRIDPKAVDAAIEPEARDIQKHVLNLSIMDIEVGLLRQEVVEVILAAPGIPGPSRTTEDRLPIVGRRPVGLGIGPDVPVGLRIVSIRPALVKPGMLVAAVRIDLVDDYLQPELMRPSNERIQVCERAEYRIDSAIIGYVIAKVAHRRGEEGRQPHRIAIERGNITEASADGQKSAHAIAIAVHKAAWID